MGPDRGRAYADPYLAGVGLGLVLLTAFVVMGRGLGASGAFASGAASLVGMATPPYAAQSPVFVRYPDGFFREWIVFELAGVVLGGFLSAKLAGRVRVEIERGPHASAPRRMLGAFAGGTFMGVGAVFARGCTSGLALTGGALLSVGAWVFMLATFASAYAVAPLFRKSWR
ncbi:MAG: YeeE/YedE thiosulfate transporter family protein [Vicinamibacteria bacterium]